MVISNVSATQLYQYNRNVSVRPEISVNTDNSVKTQTPAVETSSDSNVAVKAVDRRETLPTSKVVDFAIDELSNGFDLIGSESELAKLDEARAISDMKKDSILQEYQYFVGNIATEDGSVTRKNA